VVCPNEPIAGLLGSSFRNPAPTSALAAVQKASRESNIPRMISCRSRSFWLINADGSACENRLVARWPASGALALLAGGSISRNGTAKKRHEAGVRGQGVCLLEPSEDRGIGMLRQRSYSVLIFSSLSRLAAMDSSTELVPLIHAPPSRRRASGKGP
jgi:hypothetical protein